MYSNLYTKPVENDLFILLIHIFSFRDILLWTGALRCLSVRLYKVVYQYIFNRNYNEHDVVLGSTLVTELLNPSSVV